MILLDQWRLAAVNRCVCEVYMCDMCGHRAFYCTHAVIEQLTPNNKKVTTTTTKQQQSVGQVHTLL